MPSALHLEVVWNIIGNEISYWFYPTRSLANPFATDRIIIPLFDVEFQIFVTLSTRVCQRKNARTPLNWLTLNPWSGARICDITVAHAVLGHRWSVTGGSDCSKTTSASLATTMDVYPASSCRFSTAGNALSQPVSASFDSRASASPQLRRWNCRPTSGGQSSTTVQAGNVDHHRYHQVIYRI